MNKFKSEFLNIMHERGFITNAPMKRGLTLIFMNVKAKVNLQSAI